MSLFITLAAATLLSEDFASISAGLLIHEGRISPLAGVAACALGIFVGDLAVYGVGRLLGERVLAWSPVHRLFTRDRRARFTDWYATHAATALLASRFIPGTRLPLYLTCGALGASLSRFAVWTLVAVLIWTPLLVLAAAQTAVVVHPLAAGICLLLLVRAASAVASRRARQRLIASISRLWRWEFWPMWLFYAPVAVWVAWLTVRHRGLGPLAAANPGMQDGGVVGESKYEILSHLPEDVTLPAALIPPAAPDARVWRFLNQLTHRGWNFPLVMKPDVGQRGTGVKIVRSLEEVSEYLSRENGAVLVQRYHPGPYEAGVFYYRLPHWQRGRILSITDKHFPVATGDGQSTLADLIWSDSRLRMQASTFLTRHAAVRDHVLARGERLVLAHAGNHSQGTMFTDGSHLITPELEDRIDQIAAGYRGFFVGRFDIRYSEVERFKAGEDLAIVELNGATAESTNIYDPSRSLVAAYRQLFQQWSIVFAIGAANRSRGESGTSPRRLLALVRQHLARQTAYQISD